MPASELTYAQAMRADGKFPAVLRFAKMEPRDAVGIIMHAERRGGDLAHVDFSRTHLNEVLVGDVDEDGKNVAQRLIEEAETLSRFNYNSNVLGLRRAGRIKDLRRAREAGLQDPWRKSPGLREGVLTVHRDHFRAADDCPAEHVLEFLDDQGERARWDMRKCRRFVDAGVSFLTEEYGQALRYARADFDEQSVHIQFILADVVEDEPSVRFAHGKKHFSLWHHPTIGGLVRDGQRVKGYEVAQDRVAEFFARPEHRDMNIVRGEPRAAKEREARAEIERQREVLDFEALLGEAEEVPSGSKNAQAMFLLKRRMKDAVNAKGAAEKVRKDEAQTLALDFLEQLGVVSQKDRHEAQTRRARAALLAQHEGRFGTPHQIIAAPDALAKKVLGEVRAERTAAEKAARETAERERRAVESEEAAAEMYEAAEARNEEADVKEDRAAAAMDAARAAAAALTEKERRLDDRERDLDRRKKLYEKTLAAFFPAWRAVRAAAEKVGLRDAPFMREAFEAVDRFERHRQQQR